MDDFEKVFANFEKCSLTFFERQLVSELYPFIKRIIENFVNKKRRFGEWPRYGTVFSTNTRTILNYKEKIDRIVKLLNSSNHKREQFLKNFPKWKTQREKSIEELRKIKADMEDVRKVCNVVKIAASGVGLVGGAAIIGSLLFPPAAPALLPAWLGGASVAAFLPSVFLPAVPTVSSLAVAGGLAAAGGAAGNVGASIAELVLTQKKLNQAKEIIAEDRRLLKELGVFEFFDDLNNAIDELFGKSTSSKILSVLVDFLYKVSPHLDEIQSIQKALHLCLEEILPSIAKFIIIGTSLASVILSIFFVIFLTRRLGCSILTHRLALGLVSAVDASVEITRLIAAAGLKGSKLGELIPRQLAGKLAVGAIAGVGIALDIATIVISSIELTDGSLSDEIAMISEVIKKLEVHLMSYQKVNYELQNCVIKKLTVNEVTDWTAVIVHHIPRYACQKDMKAAINQYLPDVAWDCIKLEKLPTNGNNWLVKVPTKHSHMLLRQTYAIIKDERCLVMQ